MDVVQVTSSLDFHSSACGSPCLPSCSALFRRTACPLGIAFSGCAGEVPASPLLSQALAVPLVRPVRHTLRRQPHPAPDCCCSHSLVGIRAAISQSLSFARLRAARYPGWCADLGPPSWFGPPFVSASLCCRALPRTSTPPLASPPPDGLGFCASIPAPYSPALLCSGAPRALCT